MATIRASRDPLGSDAGFGLVETIVSAAILVVVVLGLFAVLDTSARSTAQTTQRDVANGVAQDVVERAVGGRYSQTRNDMTDVDPAATRPGPADRLRGAMDPDGDQSASTVTPATVTAGSMPVNQPQTFTLTRRNTIFTVAYQACTQSDAYQGVIVLGNFDCSRVRTPDPPTQPTGGDQTTTPEGCQVGVAATSGAGAAANAAASANATAVKVQLQILGALGVGSCLADSTKLTSGVCTLLGQSATLGSLQSTLLGGKGASGLLGGLAGGSVTVCPNAQVDRALAGAYSGAVTATRVFVTVRWTDAGGAARSIERAALVRRTSA